MWITYMYNAIGQKKTQAHPNVEFFRAHIAVSLGVRPCRVEGTVPSSLLPTRTSRDILRQKHRRPMFVTDWLMGCECLDRRVAHIYILDVAPHMLWATIVYLLLSSEGSSIDTWVNLRWWSLPDCVSSFSRLFYFHAQCQDTRHLHFTWYARQMRATHNRYN